MYSLRYGTVPIVRATGGLDDTVIDLTENATSANGIKFTEFSPAALGKGASRKTGVGSPADLVLVLLPRRVALGFGGAARGGAAHRALLFFRSGGTGGEDERDKRRAGEKVGQFHSWKIVEA